MERSPTSEPQMRQASTRSILLAFALFGTGPASSVTSLVYDAEPNNAPHEAVTFSVPDGNDVVRILGELDGNDQDAYRLIVDEDQAGRRFNLRLTGRAGALTKLDVFDFSAIADGRGRIPDPLTERPVNVLTLNARDGGRMAQADSILLPAGVYVLGVSHSGGSGAYTVELVEQDSSGVRVLDESNAETNPLRISPNGRQVVYTQGESWFEFDLDGDEAAIPYDLEYQSALGIPSTAELFGPEGTSLLVLEHDGGEPIRRPGLTLTEGVYRIRTEQDIAGVQWLSIPRGAPDISDGMEREPNDNTPMTVPFGETIQGRFDESDTDWLRFTIDEAAAEQRWDLLVEGGPESAIEVCLQRLSLNRLQACNRGSDGVTRKFSLGFSPGEYRIRLSDRGPDGSEWQLSWAGAGPVRPGEEIEPNDALEHASPLHDRGFGRGRFDNGRETDHWRFNVTGEPQLWRVQAQGDDLFELYLKKVGGETVASERGGRGQPRIRLENQFLLPGEYVIAASGTDSEYTVRVQPLGPPPTGMELEPNDDVSDAGTLRYGQEYFGLLAEDGDLDHYRFTLLGHEQVRLRIAPPVDGRIRARLGYGDEAQTIVELRREDELGTVSEWRGFLPPGDYTVQLAPVDVSDAEYRINLFREDALEVVKDREPNDWIDAAAPFPADGVLEGGVGTARASQDWYVLPEQDAPATLDLPEQSGISYKVVDRRTNEEIDLTYDREAGLRRGELAPGVPYRLQIRGNGAYRIDLSTLLAAPPPSVPAPEVALRMPDIQVQAFSPWSQRIDGTVVLSNPHPQPLAVELEAALTDLRWSLDALPSAITLGADETIRLPISIHVAPDAVVEPNVQLSVHAHSGAASPGAIATIETSLDAVPVRAAFEWTVPEPLRGGLNAAARRFGAELVSSPNIPDDKLDDFVLLFDGLARYGRWTETQMRTSRNGVHEHQQPTVRLAGDAPVPVQGVILNPTGTMHPRQMLREFEVALSMDGETFDTVVRGELDPLAAEQAFVLDEPVPARYARLIPINGAMGETGSLQQLKLGEFKVVAAPDWRPPVAMNLADPELGGHLVWAQPWIRGSAFNRSVLLDDGEAPSPRMRGASGGTVVLGFEHARAARIDRAGIEPMPSDSAGTAIETVRMQVAVDSPLGPWTPVGEPIEIGDEPAEIALDAPIWARYVRFDFTLADGASSIRYPDRIRVFEAGGPTVLGEWGHLAHVGPREVEDPPRPPALTGAPDNRSRETAVTLAPGQAAPGRALLDAYSSWYRLMATGSDNRLELTLRGRPTLEGAPRLMDAAGEDVPLYPLENTGTDATWEAWVEPGAEYWLEVVEPPRSVIFSWDTSGSVAAWLPTISSALMTYAETIKPGRDEVNLLPFGRRSPLLEDWQGHPYPLMRMLAANPRETSSSDAEGTLAAGAREMIGRPGKKAILLLTDAATSTDETLWPSLHEGRPQVFAMKLTSEGAFGGNPIFEVDLMQDWAMVRGGHFEYITGYGSLARGFDRAVAWLKRPVDFEVEVAFETVDDPSPATIEVTAGEAGVTPEARGAVEIILDASGSMLKRMGGERRIAIAKAAIRDTVQNTLPDGIPLALRVYGHREAGSCRTDLEVPLAPLDKAAFLQQVEGIQAINLARTPIADSLAAVASDLGDADGRRLVILLTDGEETCDGDPAAAIESLAEQGVDVRVNIVGFAIDDDALKEEFRSWAELGGGEYLDAGEAEALAGALEQSLRIPFDVIDGSGDVVASSFVGEAPVEVPAGEYSVRIRAATDRWVRDLQLAPGDERVVDFQP